MPCSARHLRSALIAAALIGAASVLFGIVDWSMRPLKLTLSTPAAPQPEPADKPAATPPVRPRPVDDPATPQGPVTPPPPVAPIPTGHPDGDHFLTLEQTRSLFESGAATFIDAREKAEHAAGHIPGSHNLPPSAFLGGQIPDVIFALPKDLPLVVYCGGGECDASKLVALKIDEMKLWRARIGVFKDGMTDWRAAGLPIATAEPVGAP